MTISGKDVFFFFFLMCGKKMNAEDKLMRNWKERRQYATSHGLRFSDQSSLASIPRHKKNNPYWKGTRRGMKCPIITCDLRKEILHSYNSSVLFSTSVVAYLAWQLFYNFFLACFSSSHGPHHEWANYFSRKKKRERSEIWSTPLNDAFYQCTFKVGLDAC